ncbi:MAG: thiolase family protein [Syntrophomonadaceae bacterium]|nr:thiolase family protein [Syntrophomonadaceae bacterium]
MLREVVVASAARTPIGTFLGSLKDVTPMHLMYTAAKKAMQNIELKPELVDQVIAGMCYNEGQGGNPARQVQGMLGIPWQPAYAMTLNQACGSSQRAFDIAYQDIMLGRCDVVIAGGMESMSQVPYGLTRGREGYRLGVPDAGIYDILFKDGFICAIEKDHMGGTAENLAEEYKISREEQDELAALSHQRAVAAIKAGRFIDEIAPVEISSKKGTKIVAVDENPRENVDMAAMSRLPPAFRKGGTVTAGNSSSINDGGSAVVLMAADKAKELGIKPLARVLATCSYGVPPRIMGIGPVYAIPKVLRFAGLTQDQIDLWEINEAFAAQFIACNRELKIPMDRCNVNGSGIGLGHPVGATGVRLVVSLIYEMQKRGSRYGVASLCGGGGVATAICIELIK